MSLRPFLALVMAALLVGSAAPGCSKKEEPPAKGGAVDGGGKEKPKAAEASTKPDITMDAVAWFNEFKKDPEAAKKKYKDKVIELSGTVSSVSSGAFGGPGIVYLEIPKEIIGVSCYTTDKKPWTKVSPGSKVKIRGKLPEFGIDNGNLAEAVIIEAGPNPGVVISAPELAKEFAANKTAASKKYNDKWAYVKGEVAERTTSKYCWALLKLKGTKDITVNCCFGEATNKDALKDVKAGSKVDVFGKLSIFDGPTDKTVSVDMCIMTDAK